MNKIASRFTYSFFILIFLILTPIFIAYSLGYRYNWSTHTINKLGALYIKSYPRGAEIYIDDKRIRQKTPTQITNVSSGLYTITVAKDKYVPWQKKLSVYPGNTTFAEDIVLFLDKREKTSLGGGGEQSLINRNRDKYAYLDKDNNLFVTDLEEAKNIKIATLDKKYQLLDWSGDNQRLLMADDKNYYWYDINQKTTNKLPLSGIDKIIWDSNQTTLLWYQKNKQLWRYDLNQVNASPTTKVDIDYQINDFDLKDNWLLVQYGLKDQQSLAQLNKDSLSLRRIVNKLNLGELTALLAENDRLIFILGSQAYIQTEDEDLVDIPVTIAEIHDERILLTNGYEIILYDYKNNWQSLVDRSSQVVSDVFWHPNGSYFIDEINGQTYLIEIDGRDQRNTIELLNNQLKKYYLFNKKGDRLFVLTPEENFYLTIQ
ncbi:MAG: PEGA domain-containing protein [Patescibacteria group bacterium]